jgi:hypothetical protein
MNPLEKIKQKFPYFICGASEVLESEDQTKQSKLLLVSDENIGNFQAYDQNWTKLIWLGSGITNLSIRSSDRDFSDLKLLVVAKIQPGPIWKSIETSALATYAFPIHSRLESLSYSQLMGKISYGMSLSDSLKVKAGLNYQRIQFEDDTTRLGVAGGQLGIDMALLFPLSNSWNAELGLSMLPTSLGALSSSRILNLSLLDRRDRLGKYGFVFQYQDFELTASNLNPIKLTQLSLQFLFRF